MTESKTQSSFFDIPFEQIAVKLHLVNRKGKKGAWMFECIGIFQKEGVEKLQFRKFHIRMYAFTTPYIPAEIGFNDAKQYQAKEALEIVPKETLQVITNQIERVLLKEENRKNIYLCKHDRRNIPYFSIQDIGQYKIYDAGSVPEEEQAKYLEEETEPETAE